MSKGMLTLLFSEEVITQRIDELAAEVNTLYKGEPLVVVCVLKGAFMFFAEIVRRLTCEPQLDFVRLASYGTAATSTASINFTKDVELPLEGKHVLVIEDIIDTGLSMDFLFKQLGARGARSLRLMTLLDKHERRAVPVRSDFIGFSLAEGFVVGYGLDYAENYRELPALYTLALETN